MRHLLFAALLLLCCAYGCIARVYTRPVWPHRGDSIWGTYIVKGVAPAFVGIDHTEWGILDLAVDARRLLNEFEFCERSGKEGRIDGETEVSAYNEKKWEAPEEDETLVKEFDQEECDALKNFTRGRAVDLLENVLPVAAGMHVDRLAIKRRVGDLNITNKTKYIRGACKRYIPKKHRESGLPNVDFVVYVGLWNEETSTTICSYDDETGRPTSAVIRFNVGDLELLGLSRIGNGRERAVRIAAHEIAHGLGFSTKANNFSKLLNVTEDGNHMELVSEKITEALKGRHGCGDAKGIRIDDNTMDKPYPHFDGSIAKNELMSPYNVMDNEMLYSNLTLAVFESTGYYKVGYGKSEEETEELKVDCKSLRGDQ